MTRRMLAVPLAALAILVPTVAAEATTFEGDCDFRGTLTFAGDSYEIASTEEFNGTCNGDLNGVPQGYDIVYRSTGQGSLSCSGGLAGAGTGQIDFYSIGVDLPGQPRTYVDTLDISYGFGLLGGGVFARTIGEPGGVFAVEEGDVDDCEGDSAAFEGGFDTRGGTLDDGD